MRLVLCCFLFGTYAHASDDYYLDIYDSKTSKGFVEVVFEYKGCKERLFVSKRQLETTEIASKWLKSLKKAIDEGGRCGN